MLLKRRIRDFNINRCNLSRKYLKAKKGLKINLKGISLVSQEKVFQFTTKTKIFSANEFQEFLINQDRRQYQN